MFLCQTAVNPYYTIRSILECSNISRVNVTVKELVVSVRSVTSDHFNAIVFMNTITMILRVDL